MWAGIAAAARGAASGKGRLTDISHAVENAVRKGGRYGIVDGYGGHGIGTEMHQDPHVLNHGRPGKGPRLVPGMALAIEPMITLGSPRTVELADGWTVVTRDGSMAAHVEHSMAAARRRLWVLTASDGGRARLGDLVTSRQPARLTDPLSPSGPSRRSSACPGPPTCWAPHRPAGPRAVAPGPEGAFENCWHAAPAGSSRGARPGLSADARSRWWRDGGMLAGMEGRDGMRAADADRQLVADQLRVAVDEGRLDLHEYDERLQRAYASRTYGELDALVTDLPAPAAPAASELATVPAAVPPPWSRRRVGRTRSSVTVRWLAEVWLPYLRVVAIVVAVWAATSILATTPSTSGPPGWPGRGGGAAGAHGRRAHRRGAAAVGGGRRIGGANTGSRSGRASRWSGSRRRPPPKRNTSSRRCRPPRSGSARRPGPRRPRISVGG